MESLESIALSRMSTMTRQIDIIANNIANASTTGYKAARMFFSEYLQEAGQDELSYDHGSLQFTNNALDVAIDGEGFFVVNNGEGERYTRNGHFRVDEQRQIVATEDSSYAETVERRLVTSDGYPVLGEQLTPIVIPNADKVEISPEGLIKVNGTVVEKLQVVTFDNPQLLAQAEAGVFKTDETPIPVEQPKIIQGALESSNVQPIVELTQMIEVMRSFQASQKLIQDDDEAKRKAIRTIAGIAA
jgi:flagellar basal-body rod protein FlgF